MKRQHSSNTGAKQEWKRQELSYDLIGTSSMASIRRGDGNLLDAEVDALVNTVNTVGVMGKGIALLFKKRFPNNFDSYVRACTRNEVRVGRMFVTKNDEFFPKWIINFPTKRHWRAKTQLQWVEDGLHDLARVIEVRAIKSIAIPALGCGEGGLDWEQVRPLIVATLARFNELDAVIYDPIVVHRSAKSPISYGGRTHRRRMLRA